MVVYAAAYSLALSAGTLAGGLDIRVLLVVRITRLDGLGMTWAKKQADGQVSWGDRITGPGFTLTSAADQPADGWEWFDTLADMALALGVEIRATDGEKVAVVDLASVVAEQVAAATAGAKAADVARAIVRPLEALTGGSTSTATRNALLSVRAELDKLIEG